MEEPFLAWVALFPLDSIDYSEMETRSRSVTPSGTATGSVDFWTLVLPAVGKYKAVMAIAYTNPLRILGVSDAFDVLQNKAVLKTDETQYFEGEWISVSFNLSEWNVTYNFRELDRDNVFALAGLFPQDAQDYSPQLALTKYQAFTYRSFGHIQFSSMNLPALNATYKVVMAVNGSNTLRVLGVSNPFDVLQNTATLATDEAQYFEGETIDVTYSFHQDLYYLQSRFAWVALFPHNVSDYSLPLAPLQYVHVQNNIHTASTPEVMQLSSCNLPALNAKYEVVMVITDSNPPHILGISNAFEILQNTATLATGATQYYEGDLIDVTITMRQEADHMVPSFAWVALFAHNVSDYSLPPAALQYVDYGFSSSSTFTAGFSSRNLPALNATYKVVMAITDSNPPRILGVSNTFDVLQNSASLATDEAQYYDGETIEVTYTMNQGSGNLEFKFAWVALFAHDVSDYSLPPAALKYGQDYGGMGWGGSETISFSSRNLPALNATYKAVMAVTDSIPLRILSVSNTFDVLQYSATLATRSEYYIGELIDITITMPQEANNMEPRFAWVALFGHEVSDYSLVYPEALQYVDFGFSSSNTATIQFPSANLMYLGTKYKAVMAIADSNPLRILGISNSFDLLHMNAILATRETQYFEGETIDVTIYLDNFYFGMAWVALVAHDYSYYQFPSPQYWMGGGTTMELSSTNLPDINAPYKAVMAVANSSPLEILGESNTFDVLQNSATLMTDQSLYYEGETIEVTYTMNQGSNNMGFRFAWVALFAHNVSDYSLPPAAIQYAGENSWIRGRNETIPFISMDLPSDSMFKAVMAIAESNPIRILGESISFQIVSGLRPPTLSPTIQLTTLSPTKQPTTLSPTQKPTTLSPTKQPTTLSPTQKPTTLSPTKQPTTLSPTMKPTTRNPTKQPTTLTPTQKPTTLSPTMKPTTRSPTRKA